MICLVVGAVLLVLLALSLCRISEALLKRTSGPISCHRRRATVAGLISNEAWAKADLARLRRAASAGEGFAAAFLYALDGDPRDAAIAQNWLLGKYGKKAYWTVRAADRLNSDFFKGGQVDIPEVYYDTDISGYLAFDWAYKGWRPQLERRSRKALSSGRATRCAPWTVGHRRRTWFSSRPRPWPSPALRPTIES